MKTDQELEELLRATLAGRASAMHDAAALPEQSMRRPNRRSWLPVLAAAAAVAVVAAGVVVGNHLTQTDRPAHPSPSPSASPTATHSSPAPNSLRAMQCTVPLPDAWRHAVTAGTVSVPGKKLTPLAVDDAGDVIADEAAAVAVPHTHKLVLVTRTGTVRTLYGTPPPASWKGMRIGTVSTDGNWVAFALLVQAQSGGQGPVQLELVNIATGVHRTLRPTTPDDATIVLGPALAGGAVYWTELDNARGLETGRVYRYVIATGKRTVADSGLVSEPLVSADGLYWTKNGKVVVGRPGLLGPVGFDLASAVQKGAPLLADGQTYAWQDLTTIKSIKAGFYRALPITAVPERNGGPLTGLTGDLLWWGGSALDLRTGAAVHLGDDVIATGHTAAVALSGGRLAVLDITTLPALHC